MTSENEALKVDLTRRQARNRAWDLALKHKLGQVYGLMEARYEAHMGYIREDQVEERSREHFETFKGDVTRLYQHYLAECFRIMEDIDPAIAAQVDDRLEEEMPEI